jgi:hypothetical protein
MLPTQDPEAERIEMVAQGFAKRSGRVMNGLLYGANDTTFTQLHKIEDEAVLTSDVEDVGRVVNVLAQMGYIEVETDANGVQSIRLTPSGVALVASKQGAK